MLVAGSLDEVVRASTEPVGSHRRLFDRAIAAVEVPSGNASETTAWERKSLVRMLKEALPDKEPTEFLESGRRDFLRKGENEIELRSEGICEDI
jgi:hypothetical protein